MKTLLLPTSAVSDFSDVPDAIVVAFDADTLKAVDAALTALNNESITVNAISFGEIDAVYITDEMKQTMLEENSVSLERAQALVDDIEDDRLSMTEVSLVFTRRGGRFESIPKHLDEEDKVVSSTFSLDELLNDTPLIIRNQ